VVVVAGVELDLDNVTTHRVEVRADDEAFSTAILLNVDSDDVSGNDIVRHDSDRRVIG